MSQFGSISSFSLGTSSKRFMGSYRSTIMVVGSGPVGLLGHKNPTGPAYRYFVVSGHRGRVLCPKTPYQAALLAPAAGAYLSTPSSISRALSMAPTIPLPPSRPPATLPRPSFFPLPSDSER